MALFTKKEDKIVQALKDKDVVTALSYLQTLISQDKVYFVLARAEVIRESKMTTLSQNMPAEDLKEIKDLQAMQLDEEQVAEKIVEVLTSIEIALSAPESNKIELLKYLKQYDDLLHREKVLSQKALAKNAKLQEKALRDLDDLQKKETIARKTAKATQAAAYEQQRVKKANELAELKAQEMVERQKTAIRREEEKRDQPGLWNSVTAFVSKTFKGAGEVTQGVGTGAGAAASGIGKGAGDTGSGIGKAVKGVGEGTGDTARGIGKAALGTGEAIKETGGLVSSITRFLAQLFGR